MPSEIFEASSTPCDGFFSSNGNYIMIGKKHSEIDKFDASNFALQKNQIRNISIQRKWLRPLSGSKGAEFESLIDMN